jgi:hypothetical protein
MIWVLLAEFARREEIGVSDGPKRVFSIMGRISFD